MSKLLLAVLAMALVAPAAFAAATPLDSYLDDMKTLRATFLQTLADSQGQIAQGLIQVYRALGGGWQIRCEGATGPAAPGQSSAKFPPPSRRGISWSASSRAGR